MKNTTFEWRSVERRINHPIGGLRMEENKPNILVGIWGKREGVCQ
ncbi:hypothetical protein [Methanosarcina barkeri]|nr:hypothetical protein [Methanosarcina barkeri]